MAEIQYTIKRSARVRRVNISVHHSGEIVVTLPNHAPTEEAERFILAKGAWIERTQEKMRRRFAQKIPIRQSRKEYEELRTKTLAFITERIAYFNEYYGFVFKRISIRMQSSRWGSCSKRGNLNFNYSLIKLPPKLADYIIVHELCHLKELNHGQKFWSLVGQIIPDYRERRKKLKSWVHIQ